MKKLILLLAALLSTAGVFAQGGTTGPLTWYLNNGTLTISGEEEMPDYWSSGEAPWYAYQGSIDNVVIENGVTSIGALAFSFCENFTSIAISNSVKAIGYAAFSDCKSLLSIIISDGVTHVEDETFAYCTNLTSITIPNSVTTIGTSAFSFCTSLTSITLPSSVVSIAYHPFSGCISLISIDVESENTTYASENGVLFDKSKTTLICCPAGKTGTYVIPNNVTSIGAFAFYTCENLTSITIPNSVTSIGNYAFRSCTNLTSMTIPDGITSINGTFAFCWSLSSITLPNSLTNIGAETFFGCIGLSSITIPSSVTSIGDVAFYYCENLTWITNLNPVPAEIYTYYAIFEGVDQSSCTLEVPKGSVSAYKNAEVWKEFNIVGMEGSYLVSVNVNDEEYGSATGGGIYEENTTATVTANANSGYKFVNWTKDGTEVSRENQYSFTVTEDVELVANFEEKVDIVETPCMASLQIYPNPTTGVLHVETRLIASLKNIEIFDVMGKKSSKFKVSGSNSEHKTLNFETVIDISQLASGIYLLRIQTENGVVVRKVVKN
jgi:hypothetical protein